MAIVEDAGLILRVMRYRETSRIAVALTRRHGKIHLLAKGAREYKRGFGGALEAPTRSELVFYHKKNRDLHLLHSAFARRAYLQLLREPQRYHLAAAAAEFILRVLPDEDPVPELFAELAAWLARCDSESHWVTGRGLKAFQLRSVALLGYAPQLARCVHCGRPISPPARFGVAEGGLLCDQCSASGETLRVDAAALAGLRHLARGPGAAQERNAGQGGGGEAKPDELPPSAERQVTEIIEAFLRFHIAGYRGLRSLKSLAAWEALQPAGPPGDR